MKLNYKTKQNIVFTTILRCSAGALAVGSLYLCVPVRAQDTNFNVQATQAAADQGDAKAQYALGKFYEQQRAWPKVAEYWRKSAEQGYAAAQAALGSCYGMGRGVPRDLATAVTWYRKAADQGYAIAEYAMGNFYATGGGVTKDVAQAIQWWQKAAAQKHTEAAAALGILFLFPSPENGTNYVNTAEGLRWLRRAVDAGSAKAMYYLGQAYASGRGVKLDQTESARWYREAAERGDSFGQASLGQCYLDGRGVPYDPMQAYVWFKLSSKQGNFIGTKGLGNFDETPLLTPKQLGEAEQMVSDFSPKQ